MVNNKLIRLFALFIYYCIVQYLPKSTFPGGTVYKRIRMIICKVLFKYCGDNINLGNNAYFGYGSNISVGDNSQIGPYCELYGAIKIGDDVMMGTHVIILTVDHEYTDTNTPMRLQGVQEMKPVTIEDDVWIGTRCIILPGVAIGKGSIIGAGSTVTTNVLPFSIVGGNPARLIRMRK